MNILFFLSAVFGVVVHVNARDARVDGFPDAQNLLLHSPMDHIWLEIGYTSLNIHTWTEVTTTVVNFNAPGNISMLAFFSLPEYGNSSFQDSFPMVPKMRSPPYRNGDGSYSFQGKLVMPDDAECSKEFWVPEDPGDQPMPWMIAEQGVYNLSNNMIIVQEGNITRDNSNVVKDDTPWLTHHTVVFNYTRGCDPSDLDRPCTYDDHPDDGSLDAEANYFPWMKVAALQQLQTSKRKANQTHLLGQVNDINGDNPDPKELYLSVRGRRVFTDRAQFMVATHSVDVDIFPDYEDIHEPELLAFMIYEKSVKIRCTEGLVIETQIFYDVTSNTLTFDYETVFDFAPGLFAMLGSMNSVGDSTILRSFNRSKTSSNFITQEDKCFDNEQKHTTKESAFAFVVGQAQDGALGGDELNCFAVFKNNQPTGMPTGQPSMEPSGSPSSVPSSSPSGEPSCQPSSTPSGEPSRVPSSAPSGEPSGMPTTSPTTVPTYVPTRNPTACPTFSPTAVPTQIPTLAPSLPAGNCTFNFLLFDLFGDGFYTTFVNFTTTNHREENSTTQFHQPNCTAKVVSIYSETCSIDVSMLTKDGSNPLLTWESYWILNFGGETYIGDFYSKLSVKLGEVIFTENMVDYSVPGKNGNKCNECPHPPKHNANIPPGVCESSVTAKPCPPAKGKGGGGPGAGGPGHHRALGPDDDDNSTKVDDDKGNHTHTDDDKGGKDDDHSGNHTHTDDDKGGKDDDHSGNHTHTDDDKGGKDDDHSGNHTHTDDDKGGKDDDHSGNHTHTDDDKGGKDDDHSGNYTHTDDDKGGKDDDHSGNYTHSDDDDKSGSDDDFRDHIHYAKPKPKPKPPYLVYINMYDELSNGFYDKSGDWSDYFNTQELVGTGGEFESLKAPILVPNVMAYPKYYLMTKDRQKLIKPPKSICAQNRGTEFCQEALPWNGHFIFRFAGIEPSNPADAATWEFCGLSGGINEEFEFIMRGGVCIPLTNKLTAAAFCEYGFESAISMNGAFTISGNFNELSNLNELDTSLLEKELSQVLPGELSVTITSITHESDDTFNVQFKSSIIAESAGYDGSQVDKVETLMYELEATLASAFESGVLKSKLLRDLDAVANTEGDVLRQATKFAMLDYMEIDSITYQERDTGVTSNTGDSGSSWNIPDNIYTVTSPVHEKQLSETAGIISLTAVIVGAVVAVLVATSVVKRRNGEEVNFGLPSFGDGLEDHMKLPVDSEHVVEQNNQLEEASVHPSEALPESTRPLVDLSLSSVEAGHKAIHYADDIDTALFNQSKFQYEQDVANKRSFI